MGYTQRDCAQCGNKFQQLSTNHKYCSKQCHQKARYQNEPPRRYGICRWCGVGFGIKQRKSKNVEHCSRECAAATKRAKIKKPEYPKPKYSGIMFLQCAYCKGAFCSAKRGRPSIHCRTCRPVVQEILRNESRQRQCRVCNVAFSRLTDRYMFVCGDACQTVRDTLSAAKDRASKYKSKSLRRARQAWGERFDPLDVFNRYGWLCQCCGISTPKGKRGTYDDDAPELDHVIPLALGGIHSRDNTQLLCRKCNNTKGARVLPERMMVA